MVIAVGLGNPGKKYEDTRHNVGFRVIEVLARRLGVSGWKNQCDAQVLRGGSGEAAFVLAMPQTFMNLSGRAVQCLGAFYKIAPEDWLVITDDLELPLGTIRQRVSGSDGGHRGLRSIIQETGNQGFKRIRIGIGRPQGRQDVKSFVLSTSAEDALVLDRAVEEAARLAEAYLSTGRFENWTTAVEGAQTGPAAP